LLLSVGGTAVAGGSSVTLYEHAEYGGASVSFTGPVEVSSASNVDGWNFNDKISSIRIEGDLRVTVCEGPNLTGKCETYTSSQNRLDSCCTVANDSISSFSVSRK
jgi:hypothetical protein